MYTDRTDPLESPYFRLTVALRARAAWAHRSAAHLADFLAAYQAAPQAVRERLDGELRTEPSLAWLNKKIKPDT